MDIDPAYDLAYRRDELSTKRGGSLIGEKVEYSYSASTGRLATIFTGTSTSQRKVTFGYVSKSNILDTKQYKTIAYPAYYDVTGFSSAANVTVNGTTVPIGDWQFSDKYFRAEKTATQPSLSTVTVAEVPGATVTGKQYVRASSESLNYDDDGNLTNDVRWDYTWDGENRLIQMKTRASGSGVSSGDTAKVTFDYDGQGRRIRKKVYIPSSAGRATTEEIYIYDGWNCTARIALTGSSSQRYVWGPDLSGSMQGAGGVGGLLLVEQLSGTSVTLSHGVGYDGNGNVVNLVDQNKNETAVYEYDPFGRRVRAAGSFALDNPFRFSTKYEDSETGLRYYGFRYYDPELGRWLGEGSN
ncbi:MAG: RHS repeat-associated core domain-containing protein [Verrucomicrobiales bacterium]